MAASRLRIGVLGLGRHGLRYARHLAAGEILGAELAAVWRRDAREGERVAAELGARFEADPLAILAGGVADAVVIAVPAGLHTGLTAACEKPLLLEKPIATNVTEARGIAARFRSAGLPFTVAQTLRFDPLTRGLAEAAEGLGRLTGFGFEQRIEPRGLPWEDDPALAGGGVLLQTGVHTVDALRFLTRPERVDVRAASMAKVAYRRLEDHALVHLALSGSPLAHGREVLGSIAVSKIGGSRHMRYSLYFEGGGLEADYIARTLVIMRGRDRRIEHVGEAPTIVTLTQRFVDFVRGGGTNPVEPEEAIASLEIVEAAYRAGSPPLPPPKIPAA